MIKALESSKHNPDNKKNDKISIKFLMSIILFFQINKIIDCNFCKL